MTHVLSWSAQAAIRLPKTEPFYGYTLTNAFPGLSFDEPVVIATPPGETNSLYIAERHGRIFVIPDLTNPEKKLFLDLRSTTYSTFGEAGLLGMAFHPNYKNNKRFFTYRTLSRAGEFRDELAEFQRQANDDFAADPQTEKPIISQKDGTDVHNAGDLHFGPDGYLYLSLGFDLPLDSDAHPEPQAIDKGHFGGIIRIDVDASPGNLAPNPHASITPHYRIPADNPFIGATNFNGKTIQPGSVRTEFFAVGLRNPWRFTFHPVSGELICGDVGEGYWEEVNIIRKGKNYGWPFVEGSSYVRLSNPPVDLEKPVYEYFHGSGAEKGKAIIGGLIYTGNQMPELRGKYLFGDVQVGNIWALDLQNIGPNLRPTWLIARSGISTFGKDPRDGEVLVANLYEKQIQKLFFSPPENSGIPQLLSQVGAFSDLPSLQATNSIPFEVINPLWSDGALKRRWAHLQAADGLIGFRPTEPWKIPSGSIFIKHFELDFVTGDPRSRRPIETRFLVKTTNGVYGLTYRWGNSTNDAVLVPPSGMEETLYLTENGKLKAKKWTYPGRQQCNLCHTELSGHILGFNTYQLNKTVNREPGPTNQLQWLLGHGIFENSEEILPSALPKFSSMEDNLAPIQHRVRSYLNSNCVQCHQPNASSRMDWDARLSTPIEDALIINGRSRIKSHPYKIVAQNAHRYSMMYERTYTSLDWFRMPPLASAIPDPIFVHTLTNWIYTLPAPAWTSKNIGEALLEGSAEESGQSVRLFGSGTGISYDSIFFLSKDLTGGTSEFGTSISERSGNSSEAGIMLRTSLDEDSTYAALYLKGSDLLFRVRAIEGGPSAVIGQAAARGLGMVKLSRADSKVTGHYLNLSGEWKVIGSADLALPSELKAGFFAASPGLPSSFASVRFTNFLANELNFSPDTLPSVLPRTFNFSATVVQYPESEGSITYYANDLPLGTAIEAPWAVSWNGPGPGDYAVRAVLESPLGTLTSPLAPLILLDPGSAVWEGGFDLNTRGDWQTHYGSRGALIPGIVTNLADKIQVDAGSSNILWLASSTNSAALTDGQSNRIASLIRRSPNIEFNIVPSDGGVHKLSLYFANWLDLATEQSIVFQRRDGTFLQRLTVDTTKATYVNFAIRGPVKIIITNSSGDAYVSAIFLDSVGSQPFLECFPMEDAVFLRAVQDANAGSNNFVIEGSADLREWKDLSETVIRQPAPGVRERAKLVPIAQENAEFFRVRKKL